jgi:hypothetical protein
MTWFRAAFAALIVVGLMPFPAVAAPILITSGGELTGANGVLVNGTLYNVEFIDGSCAALYNGCDEVSDFLFQSLEAAQAASQALLDQVFLDGGTSATAYDSTPTLTAGCDVFFFCEVMTYYQPGTVATAAVNYESPTTGLTDFHDAPVLFAHLDTTNDGLGLTHARWTLAPTSVPEPSSLTLLGMGAAAVGMIRRRRALSPR